MNARAAIGETFQVWRRAVFSPSVEMFREEGENTSLLRAFLWVGGARFVLMSGVLLLVIVLQFSMFAVITSTAPDDMPSEFLTIMPMMMIFYLFMWLFYLVMYTLMGVVGLLVNSVVCYLMATLAFKGKGSFEKQTYLMAAYMAPLDFARVVMVVPFLGWLLYLGVWVYKLMLARQVVEATHDLERREAYLSVMIPAGVWVLMIGCFITLYFMMVFSFIATAGPPPGAYP